MRLVEGGSVVHRARCARTGPSASRPAPETGPLGSANHIGACSYLTGCD